MSRRLLPLLAVLALAFPCVAGAEDPPKPASPSEYAAATAAEPAPVVVWGRKVAVLRAPFEDTTPEDRARRAASRIEALAAASGLEIWTAPVVLAGHPGILVGTKRDAFFALLPGDVDPASGDSLEETARKTAAELKAVLEDRAAGLRWEVLLRGLGLCAAATLAYALALWLLLRVRRAAVGRIEQRITHSRQRLSLGGVNLVPVLLGAERIAARLSALAVSLVATYLWLTFCFQQFFVTRPWAARLGTFFLDLLREFVRGALGAVPGFVAVLLIFWITQMAARGVGRFFEGVERGTIDVPWLHRDSARATRRISVVGIWMFALTVAYPYVPGSGSDAFKGISVFAGLMISLGSSGFVNHVMSGLVIAYSNALRTGDYVKVGEVEGSVEDVGPVSTKIVTPKREWITIPNGVIVGSGITNYTRLAAETGVMTATAVTIGYDAPWRQVHALLLLAAERTPGVRKNPEPFVLQKALSDFYVEYVLRVFVDRPETRILVLSDLHANIQDAFNEAGVQIMSPNFEAQPERPVLVPKSQWFAPAAAGGREEAG